MEVRRQARNSRPGPGLATPLFLRVAPSRLASPSSYPHDSLALPELGPMGLVGSPPVAVDGSALPAGEARATRRPATASGTRIKSSRVRSRRSTAA